MLGLGETRGKVLGAMTDLRQKNRDVLTIRQCLPPARLVPPAEFEGLAARARGMALPAVAAGPLVTASYGADEVLRA